MRRSAAATISSRGTLRSTTMTVFVGLDCGGSSTRVLAIDERGKALYRGQSGPANLLSTAPSLVLKSLSTAAKGCPKPDSVCGCFAGLIDDGTRQAAIQALKKIFPGASTYRAEPDYAAALAACGPDTDGCVIAGTGSIVCSWLDGAAVKTGGRGPLLGDPGSAAELGREALSAYLDGPEQFSPRFRQAVTEALGTVEERGIINALYGSSSPAKLLAEVGKAVVPEASDGSETARRILEQQMNALAAMTSRHLKCVRFEKDKFRIGLSGGLWKSGRAVTEEFGVQLRRLHPEVTFDLFVLRKAPVEGAAKLAKEPVLVN